MCQNLQLIESLATDWRRLNQRIQELSSEITALAEDDAPCQCLMTMPGVGPIISSATVAAIGTGDIFSKERDFGPNCPHGRAAFNSQVAIIGQAPGRAS